MGKSVPSAQKLQQFARLITSPNIGPRRPTQSSHISKTRPLPSSDPTGPRPGSHQLRLNTRRMEAAESSDRRPRMPLAKVVSDCVQRWFQDTLKEAKNGDTNMQVLVGQMYYSGYGVARDVWKGQAWISRAASASKSRSSVWKVSDKHPGYNASDSDSDDVKEAAK